MDDASLIGVICLSIYYFYFMFFTCFILDFSSYFYPENSCLFFLKILGSLSWKTGEVLPENLGKFILKISESLSWKSWEVYSEKLGKFCLKNRIRQNRKVREVLLENPWKFGIIVIEKLGKYLKIVWMIYMTYVSRSRSSSNNT